MTDLHLNLSHSGQIAKKVVECLSSFLRSESSLRNLTLDLGCSRMPQKEVADFALSLERFLYPLDSLELILPMVDKRTQEIIYQNLADIYVKKRNHLEVWFGSLRLEAL